jgi:hypothetical protein
MRHLTIPVSHGVSIQMLESINDFLAFLYFGQSPDAHPFTFNALMFDQVQGITIGKGPEGLLRAGFVFVPASARDSCQTKIVQ